MTMRNLIDLVEAKSVPTAPVATYGSPAYYRRYANPQATQALARFRQQAAGDITFNMSLVQKAAATAKAQTANYIKDVQEDGGEIDPHFGLTAFMDALIHLNDNRHIPDRDARWNEFQDRKPDVEQSDEMTFYRMENQVMKEFEFWCDPTDSHFANNFISTLAEFGNLLTSSNGSYSHGLDDGLKAAFATHLPVVMVFLAICNGADASKWIG